MTLFGGIRILGATEWWTEILTTGPPPSYVVGLKMLLLNVKKASSDEVNISKSDPYVQKAPCFDVCPGFSL